MKTFAYVDHLLRNREAVIADLKDDGKVSEVTGTCFKVFVTLTVLYGVIMGSQSLVHGYAMGWMYVPASADQAAASVPTQPGDLPAAALRVECPDRAEGAVQGGNGNNDVQPGGDKHYSGGVRADTWRSSC